VWIGNTASVEGGHEIVADELDVERRRIGFTNSWGVNWGQDGRFYIGFDDFQTLLANHGDVTVPVALTLPTPTPTPSGADFLHRPRFRQFRRLRRFRLRTLNDVALWADMQKWAKLKGLTS
jgi:hypothetical protein